MTADWSLQEVRLALRLVAGAVNDTQVARDLLASGVQPPDFTLPGLRAAFVAIEALVRTGGAVSRALVADRLASILGDEPARATMHVIDAADAVRVGEDVIAIVAHMRKRVAVRRLSELGRRISALDEYADPIAILADAQRDMREIATGSAALSGSMIGALAGAALAHLEKPAPTVPLGLGELDAALGGGAPMGKVTLYVTGSGMGKTTFARWSALHAARKGHPVAIIGNEADREETTRGLIEMAARLRIPNNPLDLSPAARSRYADAVAEVATLPIWIEDPPSMTAESVAAVIRTLRQRIGITLAVIDYVQDIAPSPGFRMDDHHSHAHKSHVLRACASEERIAILGLSQIGSTGEGKDRKPDPESVAGGRMWFRDAAAVLAIKRDAHSKDTTKQNVNHVRITKNRGRQVKPEAWFRYDVQTVSLIPCDEEGREFTNDPEVLDADPWA